MKLIDIHVYLWGKVAGDAGEPVRSFTNAKRIICELFIMIVVLLSAFSAKCETNHSLERFVISEGEVQDFTFVREPRYYGPESLFHE